MALKLSNQDKKDLDKFTKFFALKATQIIVQSRLGAKVSTPCKPLTAGTDWFNLAIYDLPDVLAETKKVLNGEVITARLPLCVEISLRTAEGDRMVLETWCLSVLPEQCDPSVRVTHAVYNRMGLLLKSLISVTRVTPAYKLSRRQGPELFVICYRIYMDEPQLHNLGEGFKQQRIGQLCTPIGTLQLTVAYRMKMTLSPSQKGRSSSIILKSDHFNTTLSPKHLRYNKQSEEKSTSLSDKMKLGAFADTNKEYREPEMIIPNVSFGKLLTGCSVSEMSKDIPQETDKDQKKTEDLNGNSAAPDRLCEPQKSKVARQLTMVSTNDDFIMVDLKTPFASTNTTCDLGMFYREWQTAPLLQLFCEAPCVADHVEDMTKQMESFESEMQEFDDVSLCLSQPLNNN